jgi:hypothetical protein
MTPDRLKELLDAYGADPDRWPLEERMAMLDLLARSEAAKDLAAPAAALDTLLDSTPLPMPSAAAAEALGARIMHRLPARMADRIGTPLRAAFGWPNWVALAAATVAGLVIGWSTLGVGSGLAAGPELADVLSSPAVLENRLW